VYQTARKPRTIQPVPKPVESKAERHVRRTAELQDQGEALEEQLVTALRNGNRTYGHTVLSRMFDLRSSYLDVMGQGTGEVAAD